MPAPSPAPLPGVATLRNDIFAGLVSSAVAIPLAMAFGMFAFVTLGDEYFAYGAMAGLISAVIAGFVCVLLGDRSTRVYAPRITTTFFLGLLLYSLLHRDATASAAHGVSATLLVFFAIILLGGVFQALFGLLRLGSLIKFAPHPVMAGFQNMAAVLLFLVQLGNVLGYEHNIRFTRVFSAIGEARPLSLLVAALTFAAMWNARRITTKVPPVLVGLGCGTVAYYAIALAGLRRHARPDDRSADGECCDAHRAGRLFRRWPMAAPLAAVGVGDPVGRAGAGDHRVDRRAVVRQADQPAGRASRRRRWPAGASRHRQRGFGRLWRHHQRHQYRPEPRPTAPSAAAAGFRSSSMPPRCWRPRRCCFRLLAYLPRAVLSAVDHGDRDPAYRSLDQATRRAPDQARHAAARRHRARSRRFAVRLAAVDRDQRRAGGVHRHRAGGVAVRGAHEPLQYPQALSLRHRALAAIPRSGRAGGAACRGAPRCW